MTRHLLVLVLVCLPVLGQIDTPPRVGVGVIKKQLSLAEAIEMAVKNNLEIEVEKTGISTAFTNLNGAKGFLDPRFRWSPLLEDRNTPTSSALIGVDGKLAETFHTQNFYYDQRLPWWGSSFVMAYENNRQSSTNPFVSLSPFLVTRLSLTMTLPLVRNRAIDRERANLKIANKQVGISETAFELKVIDIVGRVEEAYWNLVAARRNVEVTSDAVALAREQLARTQRMIEAGTLAPVEIAASEAELERRIDTWYASIGLVTLVENSLKSLITGSRAEALWNDEIVPTEDHAVDAPAVDDVRGAVAAAVKKRPELRQVDLLQDTNTIQMESARSQTKPALNLVGGYASAGLAGTESDRDNPFARSSAAQIMRINELSAFHGLEPLPPPSFGGIPPDLIGGWGSASQALLESRFPTVFVGLQLEWTARNRSAEAQLAQTAITERRLKLQRAQVEQSIEAQVRNAMQAIQTSRQRIVASDASARASQEKLDSEIRLFQTGESTNFLVLTRQNELADSRQRAVVARLEFNKAVARMNQALGTTLETHGITLK